MPAAARITDMHTCPMVTGLVPHVGGPIVKGAPTVITGGMPQARVTDMLVCVGPPDVIVKGAATVIVSGMPAARLGDNTAHGGVIVIGYPTVIIGDAGGGGGGGGGGMAFATAGAYAAPAPQAQAMIGASKDGTPFVERCGAPAPAGKAAAPTAPAKGTPVTLDATTLKQSPTLASQIAGLKKDGWKIEYGAADGGSYAKRGTKTIVIDANAAANPNYLTQTVSHEVGHALYKGVPDTSSRAAYVDSMLADEGAATLNNVAIQREILKNGGPDIGIAGSNPKAYAAAYDQYLKDGDAAKARAAIGKVFGTGEKTSNTDQSYNEYYGSFYDETFKPKGSK